MWNSWIRGIVHGVAWAAVRDMGPKMMWLRAVEVVGEEQRGVFLSAAKADAETVELPQLQKLLRQQVKDAEGGK